MSSQVRLRPLPRARCLFDEPIKVKVEGLRSRQAVTMRARLTDEKGVVFSSSATYRADGSGEVDLNRDPSLGGTYVGVEPMGLMWSMRPDTMHKRFQETKSLEPQLVNFSVHEEEGRILAEETNERVLIGAGVSRVPVKEGNISGVLFTPPEKMSSQVRLRLLPRARCLYDEPIKVKVEGLRSRQAVTMRARLTDEKGVVFSSSATYRADGSGEIDLNKDPSLGGTYVGVEPMGLMWSMRPDTMHKKFKKTKSLEPQLVNFSVHEEEGRILAEETNERVLIGDGVSRVPVKEGNISGVLFTPPGEGLFPAVLDISTLRSETRASLLANKGFVILSICVIETKWENMQKIHLDHFKEAMDFLKQQPKVGSKGVGIVARSKAADLALSLASFVPGVKAAVCINGCSANMGLPLYYKKKKILSPLGYDCSKLVPTESGASIGKYVFENPLAEKNKGSLIPIERAKAHFLFVAGEDDLCWDSKAYMDEMVERLKRHGKENFESVSYPGAGHLLEPPYEPFCPSAAHGVLSFLSSWGGEPKAHAAAEVHLWKKIQEFFRTHLSCDAGQAKAKL